MLNLNEHLSNIQKAWHLRNFEKRKDAAEKFYYDLKFHNKYIMALIQGAKEAKKNGFIGFSHEAMEGANNLINTEENFLLGESEKVWERLKQNWKELADYGFRGLGEETIKCISESIKSEERVKENPLLYAALGRRNKKN